MSSSSASFMGIPLSLVSLVTLTVQNSALTIVLHYSRISVPKDKSYSAASAVLLNELLKGLISLSIAFRNAVAGTANANGRDYAKLEGGEDARNRRSGASGDAWDMERIQTGARKLVGEVFSRDCWKLSIPACLYVIQNNLQFVAASNLDVPTFQVTYNLKILTTALFSVILLRRRLSPKKWFALLFLAAGVGVVQLQSSTASGSSSNHGGHEMNQAKGLLAVMCACMTSGLAGVYFEMVLKGSKADLWTRNVQLSFFSLLPALMAVFAPDVTLFGGAPKAPVAPTASQPIFANFGWWAWAVVSIQVLGGLVTALVIRYSDNIMKGFATSLAIVLSFCAGIILFDFQVTLSFLVGTAMVVASTYLYNQPDAPRREGYSPLPSTTNSPCLAGSRGTPPLSSVTTNGHANQYALANVASQYPAGSASSSSASVVSEANGQAAHRRPGQTLPSGAQTPDVHVVGGFTLPTSQIAMPQPRHASNGSIPPGLNYHQDSPYSSRAATPPSQSQSGQRMSAPASPRSPQRGGDVSATARRMTPDPQVRSRSPMRYSA
ncbi:hypothetical protein JCM10908_004222 [Rhodotorula pacifica]|uniref:uncharacterized protein n=1 Tax=Rhodotorula pacifica TaxID=1495444 RepID=UPI00316C3054